MNKPGLTRALLPLTLILALTACGSQTSTPADSSSSGGTDTTAQRVPDVLVTLPDAQDMAYPGVKASAVRTQATTPSAAAPAWTGPRTYETLSYGLYGTAQVGVNDAGEVYFNSTVGHYSYSSTIYGFRATGDSLGKSSPITTYALTGMAVGRNNQSGLVTSIFHVGSTTQPRPFPVSLFAPWSSSDTHAPSATGQMEVPNGIHRDASGFYDMEANGSTADNVSFLDATPTSQRSVNVYTASKPASASGTYLGSITPVLYPKNLDGYDADKVEMKFSGDYRGAYVVMAFPQSGCTTAACPSLYNVQYILDHKVQWSRVWKNARPVKFRFASANSSNLVILTTDGSTNPDSAAGQTHLTYVSSGGVVTLRYRVPLELWRRDYASGTADLQYSVIPNMTFVRMDDAGKLLLNSSNALLSGSFDEGLGNIYIVDNQHPGDRQQGKGSIEGSAVFDGDYVYATGESFNSFGTGSYDGNTENFVLPLNFALQDRTASK